MTDDPTAPTQTSWRDHARALADQLRHSGDLTDPAWHAAIARTPRHLLVPQAWEQDSSADWVPVDTSSPVGLARVYSPTTLITKVDPRGRAISSSTKPDLMVRMLETLDTQYGDTVLEIGTGTGYNAALLAHRLGDDNVVSVDIDADLVDLARSRLASLDAFPTLASADGQDGFPEQAPYDRIIATCSVPAVPWSWAEQVHNGARILVNIMPGLYAGNLALLEKHGDRLEGRFTRRLGQFMAMRHTNTTTPPEPHSEPYSEARQRTTTTPAELWRTHTVAWTWAALALPDLTPGYTLTDNGTFDAARITAPDGSHVTVPLGDGERTITETGPTPIWTTIENAYH